MFKRDDIERIWMYVRENAAHSVEDKYNVKTVDWGDSGDFHDLLDEEGTEYTFVKSDIQDIHVDTGLIFKEDIFEKMLENLTPTKLAEQDEDMQEWIRDEIKEGLND